MDVQTLRIFVPTGPTDILPGSALVATEVLLDDRYDVYYEGNRFGSLSLSTFEDRLNCAASRLVTRYPTTARAPLKKDQLVHVGYARTLRDTKTWVVSEIFDGEALKTWLGSEDLPQLNGSTALRERLSGTIYRKLSVTEIARLTGIAQHQGRPLTDVIFESANL
jgi:hypothetical protein